jgi:predicted permease
MTSLVQDIRFALRLLRKSPAFTTVALLTLALGIGANTAIFSIVNAILLRPLPYADSERLVKIVPEDRTLKLRDIGLSVTEVEDLRASKDVFQEVCAVWPISANLTGGDRPERIEVLAVSPNYFSMLGATPQLGRLFGPQDQAQGFAEAVVISDALWHRLFGGEHSVLGRKIQVDNDAYTIVGVLPPGFKHPGATISNDVEVWGTAGFSAQPFPKPTRNIRLLPGAIAKLQPGVTFAQAKDRTDALVTRLRTEFPNDYPNTQGWAIDLEQLQDSLVGNVRPMLLTLLGAVAMIILVASVNLANLLLARATGRQREISVRLALGASRARIIRQMLVESVLLSVTGGFIGVLTAIGSLGLLLRFVPAAIPRVNSIAVDWRVLLVALALSIASGILFGLAPALQVARDNGLAALREGSRSSGYSGKTGRMRGMLIASELAMAVILVIGAGLLLRTFWKLVQEDPGFNPSHLVTASIWLPAPNDPSTDAYSTPEKESAFIREIIQRLKGLPGTQSAAITTHLPVTAVGNRARIALQGASSARDLTAEVINVSPDYFSVLELPFARGNRLGENEKADLVVIDELAAHRFWPNEDPIGKQFQIGRGPQPRWWTVVGIVKNSKQDGLDVALDIPHVYRSVYQTTAKQLNIMVRTSLPAAALETQIRGVVQNVDPALPVFNVRDMEYVVSNSLAARRFSAALVAGFAILALLLAVIGIYGLLGYMVGQRSNELAVRMALGAQGRDIKKLIVGYGLRIAVAGLLIGITCSLVLARTVSSLLVGVHAWDPLVFLTVPAVLMTTALAASYVPARRAANVPPAVALRNE